MRVIVHHSEITLKGQNRRFFEKKLAENIKDALPEATVRRTSNRLIIETGANDAESRLKKVFGISNFVFAEECGTDFKEITKTAVKMLDGKLKGTFKVEATRSDKSYPMNSMEIEKKLGEAIVDAYNAKVAMKKPDITVHVELLADKAYVYAEKLPGLNGLPVGSGGRVVSLLSGGIDSPVSSWLMMKRGFRVIFVHFHALRSNEEAENSKIKDLVNALMPYALRAKVYYVPYDLFQLSVKVPEDYELVIFRRFMNRVAERIAQQEKAKALVTGESLAQVASQTIDSIAVTEEAVSMPIIRPLATFNKEEIITLAKKLGTYEISIKDYKDCCSIVARHPKTKPKLAKAKLFEKNIDMDKLVAETIAQSKCVMYRFGG